jgi:hypothetical protein
MTVRSCSMAALTGVASLSTGVNDGARYACAVVRRATAPGRPTDFLDAAYVRIADLHAG